MIAALIGAAVVAALFVFEYPRLRQARQIALGQSVYAENCASCHGKQLEGQPDWQTPLASGRLPAPPHDATGHSWHHSDETLFNVTRNGLKPYAGENYESDMPAFAGTLKDDEIRAVIEFVKSTWPERERTYQQQMTLQQQNK